jgi:hypothetical protein
MKHYGYTTQFAGPTDTKGAQIKVRQLGLEKLVSISYDHAYNLWQNHERAAMATHCKLEGKDLEIVSTKDWKKGYLILGVVR